jgi:hypothetical protein
LAAAARSSSSVIEVIFEPVMVSRPFLFTGRPETDDAHHVFTPCVNYRQHRQSIKDVGKRLGSKFLISPTCDIEAIRAVQNQDAIPEVQAVLGEIRLLFVRVPKDFHFDLFIVVTKNTAVHRSVMRRLSSKGFLRRKTSNFWGSCIRPFLVLRLPCPAMSGHAPPRRLAAIGRSWQ